MPICLEGKVIPPASHARYLGLHLDCKLNWQRHARRKRDLLNRQLKNYYWLLALTPNLVLQIRDLSTPRSSSLHRPMAVNFGEQLRSPIVSSSKDSKTNTWERFQGLHFILRMLNFGLILISSLSTRSSRKRWTDIANDSTVILM